MLQSFAIFYHGPPRFFLFFFHLLILLLLLDEREKFYSRTGNRNNSIFVFSWYNQIKYLGRYDRPKSFGTRLRFYVQEWSKRPDLIASNFSWKFYWFTMQFLEIWMIFHKYYTTIHLVSFQSVKSSYLTRLRVHFFSLIFSRRYFFSQR